MAEDMMMMTDENGETFSYGSDDILARRLAAYIRISDGQTSRTMVIQAAMLFNDIVAAFKMAGMSQEEFMGHWEDAWDRVETVRAQ